ncbi:hypothetical protein BJ508DRAFT_67956 [Ascobolus immersus RN42]|uniref:Uncharacterized protein n=1 Tax=Ascobolus immersus RN42 TaxID=1160509 RepID=A0A3N4HEV9_ASCIM|nr:hypothetical protein BJ508DRAFT_67956 [Ascobolus immersus RN42]
MLGVANYDGKRSAIQTILISYVVLRNIAITRQLIPIATNGFSDMPVSFGRDEISHDCFAEEDIQSTQRQVQWAERENERVRDDKVLRLMEQNRSQLQSHFRDLSNGTIRLTSKVQRSRRNPGVWTSLWLVPPGGFKSPHSLRRSLHSKRPYFCFDNIIAVNETSTMVVNSVEWICKE